MGSSSSTSSSVSSVMSCCGGVFAFFLLAEPIFITFFFGGARLGSLDCRLFRPSNTNNIISGVAAPPLPQKREKCKKKNEEKRWRRAFSFLSPFNRTLFFCFFLFASGLVCRCVCVFGSLASFVFSKCFKSRRPRLSRYVGFLTDFDRVYSFVLLPGCCWTFGNLGWA